MRRGTKTKFELEADLKAVLASYHAEVAKSGRLSKQVELLKEALIKIATHSRKCEQSVACPGCIARDAIEAAWQLEPKDDLVPM